MSDHFFVVTGGPGAGKTSLITELARRGLGEITTEVREAPTYYYAEDVHQQYLAKNPYGYRCHSNTGVPFPTGA